MLFLEILNTDDRNLVVGQRRSAKVSRNGQHIWATTARPSLVRAARKYCFGVKYLLKNTMGLERPIRVDDTEQPYTVTVGVQLALSVTIDGDT
eukprot:7277084-Pyramimonas_sp.AAC.1